MKSSVRMFKNRIIGALLSIISVVTMCMPITANAAENYNGGWAMMSQNRTVYTSSSCTTSKGSVSAREGITVLSYSGNVYHIQYSTSSGTKDGYVNGGVDTAALGCTCVAKVNSTAYVYYGPNAGTYQSAGRVFTGELVSIVGMNSPWAYIEYDTSSGRKRGYISLSALTIYNQPGWVPDLYTQKTSFDPIDDYYHVTGNTPVYAGPSTKYPTVGSVGASDGTLLVYYIQEDAGSGYEYCYVIYNTSNGMKSGFVPRYIS